MASTEYDLTYDANGNLIRGFNYTREYDGFNRLVRINDSVGNVLEEYVYDYEGKRVRKIEYLAGGKNTTTYYIDENFVRVVNSSGGINDEIYYHDSQDLLAVNRSGELLFYHPDHLGSSNLVTNKTAQVEENTQYLPFGGIESGGEHSRYLFSSKEEDSIGTYYFGARYYDPYTRHFTQPDEFIQDIYNPQNLNRYSYTWNNPYKYVDDDGNFVETALDIGFIAYDLNEIRRDPRTISNYLALAADVAGAVIPFVTGGGLFVKGITKIDEAKKTIKDLDKLAEIGKLGSDLPTKTPGGLEITKHAAERIVKGEKGRPPLSDLSKIDEVVSKGTIVKIDSIKGTTSYRLDRIDVVKSDTTGKIVTVINRAEKSTVKNSPKINKKGG